MGMGAREYRALTIMELGRWAMSPRVASPPRCMASRAEAVMSEAFGDGGIGIGELKDLSCGTHTALPLDK